MKLKPLKNHLLIKLLEKESETKSGIILAGCDSSNTILAQIVETADVYDEDYDILLKGEKILINPGTGTKVYVDGKDYYIIDQNDVLAIVK